MTENIACIIMLGVVAFGWLIGRGLRELGESVGNGLSDVADALDRKDD